MPKFVWLEICEIIKKSNIGLKSHFIGKWLSVFSIIMGVLLVAHWQYNQKHEFAKMDNDKVAVFAFARRAKNRPNFLSVRTSLHHGVEK